MATLDTVLRDKILNQNSSYSVNELVNLSSEDMLLTGLSVITRAITEENISNVPVRLRSLRNASDSNGNLLARTLAEAVITLRDSSSSTSERTKAARKLKLVAAIGMRVLIDNATQATGSLGTQLSQRSALISNKNSLIDDKSTFTNLSTEKTNIDSKIVEINNVQKNIKNELLDYLNIPQVNSNDDIEDILLQNGMRWQNVRDQLLHDIEVTDSSISDTSASLTKVRGEIDSFDENNTSSRVTWKVPALIMSLS